ncbi:hypothetical protein [Pseudidiomarina terrestris]|uniref:hypothetical protein n=1 Tax=Pseudidiomarina terrestris TaxID=2820060 RepID=UPI00265AD007|nr:hypothetical protein [Pseudidiomarina sp. 1ASP75-5]
MTMKVILQIFNDNVWHDAYRLHIDSPEKGATGPVKSEVIRDYAVRYFGEKHSRSFSANYEVNPMDITRGANRLVETKDKLKRWGLV